MKARWASPTHLTVVLSERNLKALLHKVSGAMGDSACTITRLTEVGVRVTVTAERDEPHYEGREAGAMHPLTEAALKKV